MTLLLYITAGNVVDVVFCHLAAADTPLVCTVRVHAISNKPTSAMEVYASAYCTRHRDYNVWRL